MYTQPRNVSKSNGAKRKMRPIHQSEMTSPADSRAITDVIAFGSLVVIWGGFATTVQEMREWVVYYVWLHLLLTASVLAFRVLPDRIGKQSLLDLIIFPALFLGYIGRFYLLIEGRGVLVSPVWDLRFGATLHDLPFMLRAFSVSTYAIAMYVASRFLFGLRSTRERPGSPIHPKTAKPLVIFMVAGVLIVITTLTTYLTGISLMGADAVYLPYRMAGVMFHTSQTIIPGLLLSVLYCGTEKRDRGWVLVGGVSMVLFSVMDMLLRGSRGGAMQTLTLIVSLVYITHSFRRTWMLFSAVFIVAVALAWPIMSSFREARVGGEGIIEALQSILGRSQGGQGGNQLLEGFGNVVGRVAGVEGLLAAQSMQYRMPASQIFDPGITKAFTNYVMGFPETAVHASAPGLLGWFYIARGNPLAFVGPALFAAFCGLGWKLLGSLKARTIPVAQSLWALFVFQCIVGGALDNGPMRLIAVVAAMVVVEVVYRLAADQPRRRPWDRRLLSSGELRTQQ